MVPIPCSALCNRCLMRRRFSLVSFCGTWSVALSFSKCSYRGLAIVTIEAQVALGHSVSPSSLLRKTIAPVSAEKRQKAELTLAREDGYRSFCSSLKRQSQQSPFRHACQRGQRLPLHLPQHTILFFTHSLLQSLQMFRPSTYSTVPIFGLELRVPMNCSRRVPLQHPTQTSPFPRSARNLDSY